MNIVIFGLTVSSSWGNGHATLWRGMLRALASRSCRVSFFEHDVPYYALNRDLTEIPGGDLLLYRDWDEIKPEARRRIAEADAVLVTSYCPHGIEATDLLLEASRPLRVLYDLDTPVTLSKLGRGEPTTYIGPRGLGDFDLVLSYTGGRAIDELCTHLGARRVVPLYGHVDPEVHKPASPAERFASDLSYLGTFSADRQVTLDALFISPARLRPDLRFLLGGAQYPADFPWTPNTFFVRHLEPYQHPEFYCSSRLTLNVTRDAMARMGWCPSGRLFEAAACGTAILSDWWQGLDEFFTPGSEILVASSTTEALEALDLSDAELKRVARQARERALAEHTSDRRADQLLDVLTHARTYAVAGAADALEA